ncbi:PrsW family intramembrane metalloprotease [Mycolicibacterium sp.]|uniref:PrsW family intramembrane metalloprotease n=1 Tax=Mycolicibacterium sp. TaxID=2320850 RepID=UPI0028A9354E|nr:PrsW family intramembrane metalloprotease [Mycolicibacterium sp.]
MPPLPRPVRKVGAPLAAIIAMGTLAGLILLLAGSADPVGITRGFVLATIATTLVVLCYLWLDRWEPEPPRLLVMAFLWGASVAVLFSMVFSVLFDHLLGTTDSGVDGNPGLLMGAVVGPAVEEAFKGLFLVLMMTGRRRNELNTLTDCLVYAGLTAVGFAWLENIFYLGSAETLQGSLAIAGLRLVISPFAHPFFTSMIAIGVYFALKKRDFVGKAGCVLLGYLGAVVLHGLWNGSALIGVKTYVAAYLLWMMPLFAVAIAVALASRRREQHVIAGKLPDMIAGGLLTPVEAGWLSSLKTRKAAVAAANRLGGRHAATAVKGFLTQVVELAYVRDRIDRGFGDERVFALQNEEAYGVMAARAAAGPVLQQLSAYPLPMR